MDKKQLLPTLLLLVFPISYLLFSPETFRLCQSTSEGLCGQQHNFFWIAAFWASFYYTLSFVFVKTLSRNLPQNWIKFTGVYALVGILAYILNFNLWTPGSEFFDTFTLINTIGAVYFLGTLFLVFLSRNK